MTNVRYDIYAMYNDMLLTTTDEGQMNKKKKQHINIQIKPKYHFC